MSHGNSLLNFLLTYFHKSDLSHVATSVYIHLILVFGLNMHFLVCFKLLINENICKYLWFYYVLGMTFNCTLIIKGPVSVVLSS